MRLKPRNDKLTSLSLPDKTPSPALDLARSFPIWAKRLGAAFDLDLPNRLGATAPCLMQTKEHPPGCRGANPFTR